MELQNFQLLVGKVFVTGDHARPNERAIRVALSSVNVTGNY